LQARRVPADFATIVHYETALGVCLLQAVDLLRADAPCRALDPSPRLLRYSDSLGKEFLL